MDTQIVTQASLGERVRSTFFAPTRLGSLLGQDGPWIDVLLISTLIAVASVASVPDEVFVADMQDAVTRRGQPVELVSSPEDIGRWGRLMGMLATVGTHPVIPFVVAGIVFAVLGLLFRSKVTYRQLLAIASHAMLIPAAGTVLRVIGRGAGIEFIPSDPGWPLALKALLAVDPYILWMLVVIAVAAGVLDERLPRLRAGAVLVAGYLVLVFSSTAILHRDDPMPATGRQVSAGTESRSESRLMAVALQSRPTRAHDDRVLAPGKPETNHVLIRTR